MAPICPGRNMDLCFELSSTILEDSGDGLSAPTDCDTLRFLQSPPSCQLRQGYWIGQAASNREQQCLDKSFVEHRERHLRLSLSQDARRCFDKGPGPLSFVACGDERRLLRVCDFRFQHKCEDNCRCPQSLCQLSRWQLDLS